MLGGKGVSFILSFIIILVDQITKHFAIVNLKGSFPNIVIPDFLKFVYVENYGAAFGILKHKKIFFVVITFMVIVVVSLFLFKYYSKLNIYMNIGSGLLLGGAIGNLIDRVRFGYVVDFISVRLFNRYEYPVFNVADMAIVVGTIIILILILFDKQSV